MLRSFELVELEHNVYGTWFVLASNQISNSDTEEWGRSDYNQQRKKWHVLLCEIYLIVLFIVTNIE